MRCNAHQESLSSLSRPTRNTKPWRNFRTGLVLSFDPTFPVHATCLSLLLSALVLVHLFVGGARLTLCLPTYGLLAAAAWMSPWLSRRNVPSLNFFCASTMGLFLGYVLVRAWFSPVPYLARTDASMVLGVVMVYALTVLWMVASKTRWTVVGTILVLTFLHTILSTIQFLKGHSITLFGVADEVDYGWRASGFFVCPNHLAGFLEMAIPLGLALALWSRSAFWIKLAAGYAVSMSLAALLMTGSRGGYISMVCGLGVFSVLSLMALHRTSHPRFRLALVSTGLFLVLAAGGIGLFLFKSTALQARATTVDPSSDARLDMWKAAVQQFNQARILGTGSGSYLYYGRRFLSPKVQADPVHAHNDYLELLAEFGLIGGGLFLLCFVTHLVNGWRAFCSFTSEHLRKFGHLPDDSLALNIGALSALLALAVHSLIDFNLHLPANALVMAFVLGVLASPGGLLPHTERAESRLPGQLRWVAPLAALILVTTGFHTWPGEFYAERARMAYRDGDFEQAIELANQGLNWDMRNPYLHLYSGQAKAELATLSEEDEPKALHWWTDAAESFKEGLFHFPQEQWLLLGLAEAMDELSRPKVAQDYYEQAVHWAPNSASVRAQYALHLHRNGRLDEAEVQYKASMRLHANSMAVAGLEQLAEDRAAGQK